MERLMGMLLVMGRGADALERPSSVFAAAIATKNHHSSFHTDAHISF
jgi:hypothetical protein